VTETPDLQPDTDAVLQEEPDYTTPAVTVSVKGPVRTQALPRGGGATRTVRLDAIKARRILTADPRRGGAQLVSHDRDFLVAFSKVAASHPDTMARWPAKVPLPVTASVEVHVMCAPDDPATGDETTTLSWLTESWAEGE